MKPTLALGCALVLLAPTLIAQTRGSVAVAGQSSSVSGDESTFKEQNEGEDSGLALELLDLRGTGASPWQIDGRFSTGGRGWLDLSARSGAWSSGVHLSRTRSWSALSFASDTLPSGAPVSSLVPSSTTLDPLFGIDDPHVDLLRGDAWLTRSLGTASSMTLRVGARDRDGTRVPNIGGFSFSDAGTAAFYTAGIERIDSSSTWGAIELSSLWRGVAVTADAGISTTDAQTRFDMPAYGTAGLLDVNRWMTGTDADSTWIRLAASRSTERLSLRGGVSWFDTSATPSGEDLRVTETGTVLREGLKLTNGNLDSTTSAGAAGIAWRIRPTLSLTLSGDVRSRSSDGSGELSIRSSSPVGTTTDISSDRVGGTVELAGTLGSSRLRVRGRYSTTDTDWLESASPYLQDLTRSTDRTELRADLSSRLTATTRLRVWTRYLDEATTVDLRALDFGYALSDRDREGTTEGVELGIGKGGRRLNFSVSGGQSDFVISPALFDPVFDPSLDYHDAEGSVTTFRAAVGGIWSFEHGTAWGDAGWLSTDYEFDNAYEQPGFAAVAEELEGLSVSAGAEIRPREGTRITGQLEWVRDRESLDRSLTRGSLELGQTIRERFELYGRWFRGNLDDSRSRATEYTANLFALGIRTKF